MIRKLENDLFELSEQYMNIGKKINALVSWIKNKRCFLPMARRKDEKKSMDLTSAMSTKSVPMK